MGRVNTSADFWARVRRRRHNECWPFDNGEGEEGRGVFTMRGETHSAAVWAFIFTFGPLTEGLQVNHHCDNPPCCNPWHLYAGTQAQNISDMIERKRWSCAGTPKNGGQANGQAKLDYTKARQIRTLHASGFSYRKLARLFGISFTTVRACVQRKTWAKDE